MDWSTTSIVSRPIEGSRDALTDLLRDGVRRLLARAVEAEAAAWIVDHARIADKAGRRQVVRDGHHLERTIRTGLGDVEARQPKVHDRRRPEKRERFTSAILLPYLRRNRGLEDLIPRLCLRGVSTGDFADALKALLGPEPRGCRPQPSPGSRRPGERSIGPGSSGDGRAGGTPTS